MNKIDRKIDTKKEAADSLAKQNQNNISNLTSKSIVLQKKLTEQAKKIYELEENIKDQTSRNSIDIVLETLVIKTYKKEKWNNTSSHMLSSSLDKIQISSLVTLKEHREVITKTLMHLSM